MEQTTLNPKIIGEVQLPRIDFASFEGSRTVIASVEFKDSQYGIYALLKTANLGDTEIYATKLLNLYEKKDDHGNIEGYGWGAETKTGLFMKKMGVSNFDALIGKEVIVRHEVGKNEKEFLTF